jgi:hypothetical protein
MAATERAVRYVRDVERVTMRSVPANPTWPTTQPNRRYMITPRIVRIDGVKTPPNMPRPPGLDLSTAWDGGEGRRVVRSAKGVPWVWAILRVDPRVAPGAGARRGPATEA